MDRKPQGPYKGPRWTCGWDTSPGWEDGCRSGRGEQPGKHTESSQAPDEEDSPVARLQPTFGAPACPQGSLKTSSLSPQPCWPAQCSAFPGEACLPPPLPTALQGISSHLPPLPQTAVIQKDSHFQGNEKKNPGVRGNFNHKASSSRGALTAPRTQPGAPGIVNTILRGRDINRTFVQGMEREMNVSPKWKLKLSITFCCHCCLAIGPLQLPELKKS